MAKHWPSSNLHSHCNCTDEPDCVWIWWNPRVVWIFDPELSLNETVSTVQGPPHLFQSFWPGQRLNFGQTRVYLPVSKWQSQKSHCKDRLSHHELKTRSSYGISECNSKQLYGNWISCIQNTIRQSQNELHQIQNSFDKQHKKPISSRPVRRRPSL